MMKLLRDRRRWLGLTAAVALAGGLWIYASAVPAAATTGGLIPSPRQGFLAPEFSLPQPDGELISLNSLRGRVVVINFWASWCPPCRAEMPALQRAYESLQEQGVVVLAVNATHQDSAAAALAFVDEYRLSFPILLDSSGLVNNLYQVRALPTTFFIDAEGIVHRAMVGGPVAETTIRTLIDSMLGDGP